MLTRYTIRDLSGAATATVHARSYAHAARLAERAGLPIAELEDTGPSAATEAGAQVEVTRYLLTLPETPINLDDDPTPLSHRLHDLDQRGRVLCFAQDGGTIFHLLQLDSATDAQALLHLAQQECSGAHLQGAVTTWPSGPQVHQVLHAEGLHIRTGTWA